MARIVVAISLLLLVLGGLSGLEAQTPTQTPARPAPDFKKVEFSLHVGTIPISEETDVRNWIFTFSLRVDLRSMKSVSLAPELVVLTSFSGAGIVLPGMSLNYWLGPLGLGAGAYLLIVEGVAFLPKFSVCLRTGRVILSAYVHTFFGEGSLWGGSIGYAF